MWDPHSDLIDLYVTSLGESEVPPSYFRWSFIGLLGALGGDRIYWPQSQWKRLHPNLYIWLIGPSGSGKDWAIDALEPLISQFDRLKELQRFSGRASVEGLIDFIVGVPTNRVFLFLTPELADSVPSIQAPGMIKFFTSLWSGKSGWSEKTRKSKTKTINGIPVPSWIAGTTLEWMLQVVTQEDIRGGFFSRVVPVRPPIDLNRRIWRPSAHPDYLEIQRVILSRLKSIVGLSGPFQMTREAEEMEAEWYMNRPMPLDDSLLPTWHRAGRELIRKFEMILSLSSGRGDLMIGPQEVRGALGMIDEAHGPVGDLITRASEGPALKGITKIRDWIRDAGPSGITHSKLLRLCSSRLGLSSKEMGIITSTLIEGKQVIDSGYIGGQGGDKRIYRVPS